MVKSAQPLQIRLTEPVIFLRGPSTGLDFRGRPQVVRQDGQPAMLRGLLTLRLSKPTRIRSVTIKLEGKARTEWPEGIGPRRIDTFEEHIIISESTTFFSGKQESQSRSRSARRAASLGPGVSLAQWDLDDEELDDEDGRLTDVPDDGEDLEEWTGRGRDRERHPLRSASALPALHDTTTNYHRDGFSRRTSDDESNPEGPSSTSGRFLDAEARTVRERGPSPAYTPNSERPPPLRFPSGDGYSRTSTSPGPMRNTVLSPIQSAPGSRAASDRANSTSTERQRTTRGESTGPDTHMEWIPETPTGEPAVDPLAEALHRRLSVTAEGQAPGGRSRSILNMPGSRSGTAEVRFADPSFPVNEEHGHSTEDENPDRHPTRSNRAASIRTMDSISSEDHSDHSNSSHDYTTTELAHPTSAAIQPISALSTAHNSPAPSRPASVHYPSSSEDVPEPNPRRNSNTTTAPVPGSTSTGPPVASPLRNAVVSEDLPSQPPYSTSSSRRSSLLGTGSRLHSNVTSPATSNPDLTEVRQGRTSRNGSTSTIVINHDPTIPDVAPNPQHRASLPGSRLANEVYRSGSSGPSASTGSSGQRNSISGNNNNNNNNTDERGRKNSKFSLGAALRGLSQDMKSRVSSKSRSRVPSGSSSRPPSIAETTSQIPSQPQENGNSTRSTRRPSFNQDPNFVPPYGRGGAGRLNNSRERRDSEIRERDIERLRVRAMSPGATAVNNSGGGGNDRSESRGRGRNKAMKALTGKLGLDGGHHEEEEGDVHNWKEFRKGTYNYPISFPIPVDAPPSLHAEFGSVVYKLKATVVKVGALTPNLVEDLEVTMIATPQEDDLEETENVIVERQWEEQMRYQIALSGKAFPIGGIIPVSIRIMPLMKCKIHRLSVALEEKTDYFAQNKKVARHETPRKFMMLFIKQTEKKEKTEPLLPIISSDPDAAKDSPLALLAKAAAMSNPQNFMGITEEDRQDEMFAQLMDPMGPWHLEKDLQVPDCGSRIRFTSKHEKTNISVGHWLKVTIRVERGDDVAVDAKGRRKQFDIIIETPIKILDCRVNPQWNSLPTYSIYNPASTSALTSVCSVHGNKGDRQIPLASAITTTTHTSTPPSRVVGLPAFTEERSTTPRGRDRASIADVGTTEPRAEGDDTLLQRNIVYDRLMSGQETETGEVPPSYGEALASAARSASRSQSRPRIPGGAGRQASGSSSGAGGLYSASVRAESVSGSRSRSRLGRVDS